MGLFLRPARSSESANLQGNGKGVALRALPFLFVLLLVDGLLGSGGRFEEKGEREAGGIVVVPDAAVVETGDGGVGLAHARSDEAAGGADAEFNVWREDAEAFLEMIVEVVGGLAGTEAVGGVARGKSQRESGVVVEQEGMGSERGCERGVAWD